MEDPKSRVPARKANKKLISDSEKDDEFLPVPKNPVPVNVEGNHFNPHTEDMFMEDDLLNAHRVQPKVSEDTQDTRMTVPYQKKAPRQSEVQSQVDQRNVLGRILSQPVTLQVGEVFGISKEMTLGLRDVLKPKPALKTQLVQYMEDKPTIGRREDVQALIAASFASRKKGTLIKLPMTCEGRPIMAIVDTGSQLNIAHPRIWREAIQKPRDIGESVTMNDANGGERANLKD